MNNLRSGFTHILLILIIAIVGVFVAYYFIKVEPTFRDAGHVWTTPTPSASSTPDYSITTSDKDGWKTYTNKEYGFEFQYPSHLTVADDSKITAYVLGEETSQIASFIDYDTIVPETDKPYDGFDILVFENPDNLTFNNFIAQQKSDYDNSFRPSDLSGDQAQDYEVAGENGVLLQTDNANWYLYIPVPKNNKMVIFSISIWNEEFGDELDKVFSNFQFIGN